MIDLLEVGDQVVGGLDADKRDGRGLERLVKGESARLAVGHQALCSSIRLSTPPRLSARRQRRARAHDDSARLLLGARQQLEIDTMLVGTRPSERRADSCCGMARRGPGSWRPAAPGLLLWPRPAGDPLPRSRSAGASAQARSVLRPRRDEPDRDGPVAPAPSEFWRRGETVSSLAGVRAPGRRLPTNVWECRGGTWWLR